MNTYVCTRNLCEPCAIPLRKRGSVQGRRQPPYLCCPPHVPQTSCSLLHTRRGWWCAGSFRVRIMFTCTSRYGTLFCNENHASHIIQRKCENVSRHGLCCQTPYRLKMKLLYSPEPLLLAGVPIRCCRFLVNPHFHVKKRNLAKEDGCVHEPLAVLKWTRTRGGAYRCVTLQDES